MLLLVTLGVVAVLTHEGNRRARLQEEAVRWNLHTSASFIAGRYAEQIELGIASTLGRIFSPARRADELPIEQFVPAQFDFQTKDCVCPPSEIIDYHFAYDFLRKKFAFQGRTPPLDEQATLRLVLQNHPTEATNVEWGFALAARGELADSRVIALNRLQDTVAKQFTRAVGFVAKPAIVPFMITPPDEFIAGMRVDTAIAKSFEVAAIMQHDTIVRGGPPGGEFRSTGLLGVAFGGIRTMVAVSPPYVPQVAGGSSFMPYRVPFFLGLLVVSATLILAVIFLFRRESELIQARTDFVSGVSHELRTPLAQIRMFTETLLLGRTRNEAERRRSLEIIDQEAKRLTALVDNVLALSRSERGVTQLAPSANELAPTIREVIDTFRQMPRAQSVDIRAELEPRLIATVDPNAFRQILINLLDNAVKYGPAGQRIVVGLAMFEEHARLWVDDEGPGIPIRERERVFEPFYRSTIHADSRVNGSGIGLAVVRELAILLNGRAWAEQAPNAGARIIVEFPEAYLRADEAAGGWAVA